MFAIPNPPTRIEKPPISQPATFITAKILLRAEFKILDWFKEKSSFCLGFKVRV
jgi:hypothetical protein